MYAPGCAAPRRRRAAETPRRRDTRPPAGVGASPLLHMSKNDAAVSQGRKLKEGQHVWVKDTAIAGTDVYTKAHILGIDGNKVTVETSNDVKSQELILPAAECFHPHPGDDVPDHCQLMFLSQPTMLENTRKRFAKDKIYTLVGDILLAINPFKWIDGIYTEDVMQQCKGKKLYNAGCGPHVFAVAEKAFVHMRKKAGNQCIVVSGESGAGKTEANRQLMNYLIWRGSEGKSSATLSDRIIGTNPILEAFGNAKTTRNNNSSRFGRMVLVQFSGENEVVGAEIRTFLLERSRVVTASNKGERAYHIMYQVCAAGAAGCTLKIDDCRYLSMSGTTTIDGVDDVKEFKDVHNAMLTVGVGDADANQIWLFIQATLLLGNIQFGKEDAAKVQNGDVLQKVQELLGIADITKNLETRSMTVRGNTTEIPHKPYAAELARDAMVKIMYARLFSFIVTRINSAVEDQAQCKRYIGLLDVYGFEFFETNSFEQLCINFANEKLQQFFLVTVFTGEEKTYKDEGVPWTPIPYADNKGVISLIENPTDGIYVQLDSACKGPSPTGKAFCASLHQTHGKDPKSKVFGAPKISKTEKRSKDEFFVVKHFAGDVVYHSEEFLEKNNDSLDPLVEDALLASKTELVVAICTPEPVSGKAPKRGGFASVGAKFVKSLAALMSTLEQCDAHFVRCIKPNPELVPQKLHGENVVNQLRMSGMLDAVKLIQAGYPTRIPYDLIHANYAHVMPEKIQKLDPPSFCEVISEVCGVGKNEYCLGVTLMFFKMGAAAFLEELQDADPAVMGPILVKKLELFERKKVAKVTLEKNLHMYVFRRRYKVLLAEKRRREEEERRKEEERKRREAEAKAREEEARKRQEEAERKRQEEEAARQAEEAQKAMDAKYAEEKARKEAEAQAASQKLGDVEAMISVLEQDADLEQAVDAAGGVKALIAMASDHENSELVQGQFAGVLRDLCCSDEIALEIHEAGGVKSLVEAARRHFHSVEVQGSVAGALRNLAELDEVAADIAALGGLEMLVDASSRHQSIEVQARVAGALWALSVHDEIADKIGALGGLDCLITIAKNHPMDDDVQSSAAGAMRNLCCNLEDHMKQSIADMEGIEVLITAAVNHVGDELVLSQVAGALRNLSLNEEVAERIDAKGGIQALVQASFHHRGSAKVQAGVAGALRNLSVNDEIAAEIAQAGGIGALISASQEHARNADVQGEVAGALWGLSVNDEIEKAIAQEQGIKVLVDAAKIHYRNPKVQARVAGALRKMSADDENKKEIAEAGGVQTLIESSRVHLDNAVVQASVAGVISNLSVDDEIERSIASEGGIEALIDAAQAHGKDVKVQSRVMRALTNLSVHDENKARIASVKGIVALVQASLKHEDSAAVQAGVAGTLRNLSVSPEVAQVIADNDGIKSLINAAKIHSTNAIVQTGVAGALRNLSVKEALRKAIVAGGGMETLAMATQVHADNEKLQAEVAAALRNLAGEKM